MLLYSVSLSVVFISLFALLLFMVADVNECSPDSCGNGTCVNMVNHGFDCSCFVGFEASQNFDEGVVECVDTDECYIGIDSCEGAHSSCVNVIGTYTCVCDSGFVRGSVECVDVDECTAGYHNCTYSTFCVNTVGMFICCE